MRRGRASGFCDAGDRKQRALDLDRGDLLAAAIDDLLDASAQE